MYSDKVFSKISVSLFLMLSTFALSSCGTSDMTTKKDVAQNIKTQMNFRDWTFDRVQNRMESLSFGIKSSGDELKPKFDVDLSIVDANKTLATTLLNKNTRAKFFGAASLSPAIDLGGAGTADDVFFFTTDNKTGSNMFALGSDGNIKWEQQLTGQIVGVSPTFSANTVNGKKIMYVSTSTGNIYCIDTSGRTVSTTVVSDSFQNSSVWVDSELGSKDYIYLASTSGYFYRFKMDLSNPNTQSLSQQFQTKIDDTSFESSPVSNNGSIYLGGQNGTLYQIVPNSGGVLRTWDLSLYSKNKSATIRGIPTFWGNIAIVPAGGYLFRIDGSTVTPSPLLELKEGANSRASKFGTVFESDKMPIGTITTSPVIDFVNSKAYISNTNTVFELDISTINSFKGSANYCITMSGRLSDLNLVPKTNGNVVLSTELGVTKIVMVDENYADGSYPYLNFFTQPLSTTQDSLEKYLPLNEFDSKDHAISAAKARIVNDIDGNTYFTTDNGNVNIISNP